MISRESIGPRIFITCEIQTGFNINHSVWNKIMEDIEIIFPSGLESSERPDVKWERFELETVPKWPPIGYADKLMTDIIKFEPCGQTFEDEVVIKIPHESLKCDKKRVIHLFESDDGEKWKQHETRAVETVEGDDQNEKTVIYADKIPGYVALINQLIIERVIVGPEGGSFSSEIHPGAQVTLAEGVLMKEMRFGLQVQLVPKDTVKEALKLENGVSISPFVSIYPFMRKFHKPMWVTIPLPDNMTDNDSATNNSVEEQQGAAAQMEELPETEPEVKDDHEEDCEPSTSQGNKSSKLSLLKRLKRLWKRIRKPRNRRDANQGSSKNEGEAEAAKNVEEAVEEDDAEEDRDENTANNDPDAVKPSPVKVTNETNNSGVARMPKWVRLLACLIDEGNVPVWEDVTDVTPLVDEPADVKCKDEVLTFETKISGRFCLISVNHKVEENIKDIAEKLFVYVCEQSYNKSE